MELGGYVVRENYGISCLPVGLNSPIMLFVLFVWSDEDFELEVEMLINECI